jgi:hypothetical protein
VIRDLRATFKFSKRFLIQAGTYVLASSLPSSILDALINLPHFLVSVRNGLLPVPPAGTTDQLPPPVTQQQNAVTNTQGPAPPPPAQVEPAVTVPAEAQDDESSSGDEKQSNRWSNDDADVESNAGDAPVVESSWVNLRDKHD